MKRDTQAAPTARWQLLSDTHRAPSRKRSVWSVILLVGILALGRGHDGGAGSTSASPPFVDRAVAPERPVPPAPTPVLMRADGGRVDGMLARSVIQNAPVIEGTGGHLVVDTTQRISPDLVRELTRAPYLRDLSNEMNQIVEDLKSVLIPLDANVEDVSYAGIGLGEGYIGVNINRRLYSVRGRNSILVNPYRIAAEIEMWVSLGLTSAEAPKEFSGRLVSAILHEIAHQSAREHDEAFAATLTRFYGSSIPAVTRSFHRLQEEIDEATYRRIVADLNRLRSQWGGRDILALSGPDAPERTRAGGPPATQGGP